MKRRHQAGFTLIELLVVIGIIALLAGITTISIGVIQEKKKVMWTRGRINEIRLAIGQFRLANNQYPWDIPAAAGGVFTPNFGDVAKNLNPSNDRLPGIAKNNLSKRDHTTFGIKGPYEEIDGAGRVVDPWGSEYVVTWDRDKDRVVISSNGKDGIPDTSDDIRSDE